MDYLETKALDMTEEAEVTLKEADHRGWYCPLLQRACWLDNCAWYDSAVHKCAVLSLICQHDV